MYYPITNYYTAYSYRWVDLAVVYSVLSEIKVLNFDSKHDRSVIRAHLLTLSRRNDISFNQRFPDNATFISVNIAPFLFPFSDMLYGISVPNHCNQKDYNDYSFRFHHGLHDLLQHLQIPHKIITRQAFEIKYDLHWE